MASTQVNSLIRYIQKIDNQLAAMVANPPRLIHHTTFRGDFHPALISVDKGVLNKVMRDIPNLTASLNRIAPDLAKALGQVSVNLREVDKGQTELANQLAKQQVALEKAQAYIKERRAANPGMTAREELELFRSADRMVDKDLLTPREQVAISDNLNKLVRDAKNITAAVLEGLATLDNPTARSIRTWRTLGEAHGRADGAKALKLPDVSSDRHFQRYDGG